MTATLARAGAEDLALAKETTTETEKLEGTTMLATTGDRPEDDTRMTDEALDLAQEETTTTDAEETTMTETASETIEEEEEETEVTAMTEAEAEETETETVEETATTETAAAEMDEVLE